MLIMLMGDNMDYQLDSNNLKQAQCKKLSLSNSEIRTAPCICGIPMIVVVQFIWVAKMCI